MDNAEENAAGSDINETSVNEANNSSSTTRVLMLLLSESMKLSNNEDNHFENDNLIILGQGKDDFSGKNFLNSSSSSENENAYFSETTVAAVPPIYKENVDFLSGTGVNTKRKYTKKDVDSSSCTETKPKRKYVKKNIDSSNGTAEKPKRKYVKKNVDSSSGTAEKPKRKYVKKVDSSSGTAVEVKRENVCSIPIESLPSNAKYISQFNASLCAHGRHVGSKPCCCSEPLLLTERKKPVHIGYFTNRYLENKDRLLVGKEIRGLSNRNLPEQNPMLAKRLNAEFNLESKGKVYRESFPTIFRNNSLSVDKENNNSFNIAGERLSECEDMIIDEDKKVAEDQKPLTLPTFQETFSDRKKDSSPSGNGTMQVVEDKISDPHELIEIPFEQPVSQPDIKMEVHNEGELDKSFHSS